MKKIIFNTAAILLLSLSLSSCEDAGATSVRIEGNEQGLPDELKGLKVYNVSTGAGSSVKVAILDGKVNSTTYIEGKVTKSTIIINKEDDKIIQVSQILMENDSLIVCRK